MLDRVMLPTHLRARALGVAALVLAALIAPRLYAGGA
jgi:hypothetical protein